MTIFKKLAARKAELHKQVGDEWPHFVADVVDEKVSDADEILAELERLQKSPADLEAACGLLIQRREWARQVAVGDVAESEYRELKVEASDAQQKLEDMIQAHKKQNEPLDQRIHACRQAMSRRADAARQLKESAGQTAHQGAFAVLDEELGEIHLERQTLAHLIKDRTRWLDDVRSLGNSAASSDVDKLVVMREGLDSMAHEDSLLRDRINDLQAQRNEAESALLRPEAI